MKIRPARNPLVTHPPTHRPAYTLVELVVSLAAASILLTGLTSAVFFASRALPDENKLTDRVIRQSEIAGPLVAEVQSACYITERTAHAITFTVADRDGNGSPERIRYAWSGTPGDPLTRQYNSGTAVTVLDDVRRFDLAYDLKSATEQYAGAYVEGPEALLASDTSALISKDYKVDPSHWIGQYFQPTASTFPSGALNWRVTRVIFQAKKDGAANEQLCVQMRTVNPDNTPTTTVVDEQILSETALTDAYQWKTISFQNAGGFNPAAGACLVLQHGSAGGASANIKYDSLGGSGRVTTSDTGKNWSYDSGRSVLYYAYGTVTAPGPAQTATRQYVTGVRIALLTGADTDARLDTTARTLNMPEVLSAVWELDFNTNPTTLDMNADGVGDWVRRDGQPFNTATLVSGVWQADATLDTRPNNNFTALTTIDLRFRNTSVGGNGAVFWINADWSSGTSAPLYACLQLQADNTQRLSVYSKQNSSTPVLLLAVPSLSNSFVTLRLLIDPALDTVNVRVDGVEKGTFSYPSFAPANDDRFATVLPWGSNAEFDYVRIRVGGN